MVINRSVDYAVAGIIHLATLPPGAVEPVEEIARNRDLPGHAFAAVVRRLARAGLVFTQRGTGGGVSLARDPSEISMRDVVEAVEGPIRLVREGGSNGATSFTRPVWERVERAILAELDATKPRGDGPRSITQPGHRSSVTYSITTPSLEARQ